MDGDGNKRILVTFFALPHTPLCTINCYLPSGTVPEAVTRYKGDFDAIHEICIKYGQTHNILLLGDLNQDHYHRDGIKEHRD